MPFNCAVPACKNRFGKMSNAIGVSYHVAPGDKVKRQRWSDALGIGAAGLSAGARVCSEHFVSGDYVRSFKSKRRLKRNAVPQRLELAQLRLQNGQETSTATLLCQHCRRSEHVVIRHAGCQVDKGTLPSKSIQKDIPLKWDACTQTPASIRHCGIQKNLDEAPVGPKPPFVIRACAACRT